MSKWFYRTCVIFWRNEFVTRCLYILGIRHQAVAVTLQNSAYRAYFYEFSVSAELDKVRR
jgi:hypothetical protein